MMMHDKICLVTGATGGMGKAIAEVLAREGATVVLVARDASKARIARDEITASTGNDKVDYLVSDLSSQLSIRNLAQEFQQRYSHLHVLVNNAGAHIQERSLSVDGIEMNLAVNHLAAFLLTQLLLDTLQRSTPARIVNVASNAMTASMDLDDLQSEKSFEPFKVYGQAKLAMVLCTYALARRLVGTGVTVNALHPGITATGIVDQVAPPLHAHFSALSSVSF